jgi:predicted secreted hydrolase
MRRARTRLGSLVLLALGCAGIRQAQDAPPAVTDSSESVSTAGFATALEPRRFEFPLDHGPHPAFRQEWWYFTGNLDAANGERFGFELTFFRVALEPPQAAAPEAATAGTASAWRTREIYVAHFAVTDVSQRRFQSAQKLSRAALGLAGAQALPLHVWLDDWSLEASGPAVWRLRAAQPGYAIELALEPQSSPVLNGVDGLSRKSERPEDATYYYSIPRLLVRGRLVRGAQPLEVRGLAWADREWGSGSLGPREAGWDWFGLQLEDGSALMFYALRDKDGQRDVHSAGTWVAAEGTARALANADVDIAVTREWRSASGERYPGGWHIRVPALALDLTVRPVLADQELQSTPRYWEGAVDVSGERGGATVGGRGYVELVGYAQERPARAASGANGRLVSR